jgi:Holliday junction resolvase
MKVIQEGQLRFFFPEEWLVNKYDESRFQQQKASKCQGTKAVDILALSQTELLMIEVKDFSGYRIVNKARLNNADLAIEFAHKVRDTIASLYGAHRLANAELEPFCQYLFTKQLKALKVILFLEEDRPVPNTKGAKQIHLNLITMIERQLKFLGVRSHIYNRASLPSHFQWLAK